MKSKNSQVKAKTLKPITARKAPAATDSHAAIKDWIQRVMPDLHPTVKRLDELIRQTIPGLQYAVKWKRATGCRNLGGSSRWSPTTSP
jgi:hypothetical protein